ncbi:MAG: ImmA/IrrE family metallo-endopeptidase [Oscillospiraceae bacterium]|nr:ImmA/IrrE family metallo-endopeptidase [Oscillospiraceae bacterium]
MKISTRAGLAEIYERADIHSLPIDPLAAARSLGIKTVSYKIISEYYHITFEELYRKSLWGFSFLEGEFPVIALNESACGERRRRFTAAHELGHCVLGHLRGRNLESAEREANRFAADFLAPLCVIEQCGVRSVAGVARLCGISESAAEIRLRELRDGNFRRDSRISEQFSGFIVRYFQ